MAPWPNASSRRRPQHPMRCCGRSPTRTAGRSCVLSSTPSCRPARSPRVHPHPAGGQPAHRRAQAGRPAHRAPRRDPPPVLVAPRVAGAGARAALRVLARRPRPPEAGRRDRPSPTVEEAAVTAEIQRRRHRRDRAHQGTARGRVLRTSPTPRSSSRWIGDRAELDPRPGGGFALDMGESLARGAYLPSSRRTGSCSPGASRATMSCRPASSTVEVVLTPDGDDTMVVLTHRGLPGQLSSTGTGPVGRSSSATSPLRPADC